MHLFDTNCSICKGKDVVAVHDDGWHYCFGCHKSIASPIGKDYHVDDNNKKKETTVCDAEAVIETYRTAKR